jgi:hypothetical protein
MTLTNHLLTGAVLAKVLPLPIAISLAFASHFVLDALPHFGIKDTNNLEERQKNKKLLTSVWLLDVILAILLTVWLIGSGHTKWFLVGLVAYSPDLLWIYRYTVKEKFGKLAPTKGNSFIQFHSGIQKLERIWGGGVELVYAAGMFFLLK